MKRFIFLGLFLSSLGSVLFSSNAFALSDFERSLIFYDRIAVKQTKYEAVDITDSWRTIVLNACAGNDNKFRLSSSSNVSCDEFFQKFDDVVVKKKRDYVFNLNTNTSFNPDSGFSSRADIDFRVYFSNSESLGSFSSTCYSTGVCSSSISGKDIYRLMIYDTGDGSYGVPRGFTVYLEHKPSLYFTISSRDTRSSNVSVLLYSAKISNIPQYSSDYAGKKIQDSTIDFTPKTGYEEFTSSIFEEFKECSAFDLGCLVENFLIFIRNIFTFIIKLPEFIVELFKFLFVPDQEFLATYFEDMKSYAISNSGFLKVPVTVFNSFMKMIRDVTANSGNSAQNLIIHLNMMLGNGFNCGLYDSNSPYKLPQGNVCSGDYLGSVSFFGKEFRINQSIYPIVDKFLVYIRIFLQGSFAIMLISLFYKRIQIYAGRSF